MAKALSFRASARLRRRRRVKFGLPAGKVDGWLYAAKSVGKVRGKIGCGDLIDCFGDVG